MGKGNGVVPGLGGESGWEEKRDPGRGAGKGGRGSRTPLVGPHLNTDGVIVRFAGVEGLPRVVNDLPIEVEIAVQDRNGTGKNRKNRHQKGCRALNPKTV